MSADTHRTGRVFTYPGRRGDYLKQAAVSTAFAAALCLVTAVLVVLLNRFVLDRARFGPTHLAVLLVLIAGYGVLSAQVAVGLSRFRIIIAEDSLEVQRVGVDLSLPLAEIAEVERIRLPGWWPVRADLKPWRDTARYMIRIRPASGRPVTFASGMVGEEDLLDLLGGITEKGKD